MSKKHQPLLSADRFTVSYLTETAYISWGLLSDGTAFRSICAKPLACLVIPLDPCVNDHSSHSKASVTQLIYCFNPETVKTLHVSITVHTIHFIFQAFPPRTTSSPYSTWVYCFLESPCDLLCRAQDYVSAWGFGVAIHLGRARIGSTGGRPNKQPPTGSPSNPLNGSKRWETLSHIKRLRPHFTHSAQRSLLPTARLQQGLMGLQLSATVFDQSTLRFAWEPVLRKDGEHDFVPKIPWLHRGKD